MMVLQVELRGGLHERNVAEEYVDRHEMVMEIIMRSRVWQAVAD